MTGQQRRLLVRILWKQVHHNKKIRAMEKQVPGLDLDALRINVLYDVLDYLGYQDGECDLAVNKFFEASGHHSRMDGFLLWAEKNISEMRRPLN